MKFFCYDDDQRLLTDPTYPVNHGSFATITRNLNKELEKRGLLESPEKADVVGFASGLKLDFGFHNRRRFLIHVWETTVLPQFMVEWRKKTDTLVCGLSKQISDLWGNYGFPTPIVDIGCDTDFWQPLPEVEKNDKFTVLSVTSCNFRSGVNILLQSFMFLPPDVLKNCKLIIKNTDERATPTLMASVKSLQDMGLDIEYCCERQTLHQIRELYSRCHVLAYIPINTSAGLPILEAGACELPVVVGDFCPTNIYPSVAKVDCYPITIAKCKQTLTQIWGLPYTFPEGMMNENAAQMFWIDHEDLSSKLLKIYSDYRMYMLEAQAVRKEIQKNWTWERSCNQLLTAYEKIQSSR